MTWSSKRLAETLDGWLVDGRAIITETAADVVVGKLTASDTLSLLDAVEKLGWQHGVEDDTGSAVQRGDIEQDFEPFKVSMRKPLPVDGRERVLTNAGMLDWLSRPPAGPVLEVCRLSSRLETFSVIFAPWDSEVDFTPDPLDADPRIVVKEHHAIRSVPGDLSPWIVRPEQAIDFDDPAVLAWAERSALLLVTSLANEHEAPGTIVFKGPPVARYDLPQSFGTALGEDAFVALQTCARWVFTSSKEMEMRHILMSAEFSRFAPGSDTAVMLFRSASGPALEGAKIAFELGLHKISTNSLKALADLRKAVSDEASKLGDSTRQLAAAVSGALFGGVGLIVARLTLSTSSVAVAGGVLMIGFVLCLYVAVTIVSGRQFVSIQRDLREQWRDRLYRFLPEAEYHKLVTSPAARAEKAFNTASAISALLAAVLMLAVLLVSVPELVESYWTWEATKTDPTGESRRDGQTADPADIEPESLIVVQPR